MTLGTCTKCRARTLVDTCKVEAFAGEARPVVATLCDPCITAVQVVKVTRLTLVTPERLAYVWR